MSFILFFLSFISFMTLIPFLSPSFFLSLSHQSFHSFSYLLFFVGVRPLNPCLHVCMYVCMYVCTQGHQLRTGHQSGLPLRVTCSDYLVIKVFEYPFSFSPSGEMVPLLTCCRILKKLLILYLPPSFSPFLFFMSFFFSSGHYVFPEEAFGPFPPSLNLFFSLFLFLSFSLRGIRCLQG